MVEPLWKIFWQFPKNLNKHLPYDPTFPFLGTNPRVMKAYVCTKGWTFIDECPLTDE